MSTLIVALALGGSGGLSRDLDRLLDDASLARSTRAVAVVRADDGRFLYERDRDALMVAASVTKAWTAVAALDTLGADATVTTRLVTTADPLSVVVVGAGDPTVGADPDAWLDGMVDAVRAAGVDRVPGDVIADARAFDFRRLGRGWTWDDALWRYSAPVTALQLHGNVVTLRISAGDAAGDPVTAAISPLPGCVPLRVDAVTVDRRLAEGPWVDRAVGSTTTVIGGTMAPGEARTLTITLPDPDACVAAELARRLEEAGIPVDGEARVAVAGDDLAGVEIGRWSSPPLVDLLDPMLVHSDNLVAETVARWLDPTPTGKSYAGAEPVIRDTLRRAGVPDDAVVLADGSGLSRYGMVSADAVARVFRYALRRPWRETWLDLLPVAGEEGTLARRMVGGPADGRVRGKTGSMTGVFNLAAYVPMADGEVAIVVTLADGVVARRETIRDVQDRVVEHVARSSSEATCRRRRR